MDSGARVKVELLGEPTSVREARRLVLRTLDAWDLPHLEEHATLLVSETVTNAVLHARTGMAVELRLGERVLRVTVSDGSPRRPSMRGYGPEAGTGRGLGLVAALASDWGTDPGEAPWQKDVWFELPLDPAALRQPVEDQVGQA